MITWFTDMTDRQIDKLGKEINRQESDHVFRVTAKGPVDGPGNVYAPSIYHDETDDITADGGPVADSGWTPLTGYTGQYGYHGAVMHPSEFIGGGLASDIIEMSAEADAENQPLLWTVTTVEVLPDDEDDEDSDPDPAGWAILYRKAS